MATSAPLIRPIGPGVARPASICTRMRPSPARKTGSVLIAVPVPVRGVLGPAHRGLDRAPEPAQVPGPAADVLELAGLPADVVLGVQRAVQDGPAAVDLAHAVPVGDADVAVVDDVGPLVADRGQRLDFDPGALQRAEEHGQALVFGQVRIGAGDQEGVLGVLGVGGEDLLPVDDPFVAVADRPGLGPGDVRSAVRLGVAQRQPGRSPGHPRRQFRQQPRFGGRLDGRPDQPGRGQHAEPVRPGQLVPAIQFVLEDRDAYVVELRAAVFAPPPRHQPAPGPQGEVEGFVEVVDPGRIPGGHVLIKERPDLIPERLLGSGEDHSGEIHDLTLLTDLATGRPARPSCAAAILVSRAQWPASARAPPA